MTSVMSVVNAERLEKTPFQKSFEALPAPWIALPAGFIGYLPRLSSRAVSLFLALWSRGYHLGLEPVPISREEIGADVGLGKTQAGIGLQELVDVGLLDRLEKQGSVFAYVANLDAMSGPAPLEHREASWVAQRTEIRPSRGRKSDSSLIVPLDQKQAQESSDTPDPKTAVCEEPSNFDFDAWISLLERTDLGLEPARMGMETSKEKDFFSESSDPDKNKIKFFPFEPEHLEAVKPAEPAPEEKNFESEQKKPHVKERASSFLEPIEVIASRARKKLEPNGKKLDKPLNKKGVESLMRRFQDKRAPLHPLHGIEEKTVARLAGSWGLARVQSAVMKIEERFWEREIKNPAGLLVSAIQGQWGMSLDELRARLVQQAHRLYAWTAERWEHLDAWWWEQGERVWLLLCWCEPGPGVEGVDPLQAVERLELDALWLLGWGKSR